MLLYAYLVFKTRLHNYWLIVLGINTSTMGIMPIIPNFDLPEEQACVWFLGGLG